MLIAFGGLPGTGKTTLAQALARRLTAVYLRIDTLEQSFLASGNTNEDIGPAGYLAAYAVAKENLRLGLIADSVNPLHITRKAWKCVAQEADVRILEIELICSDTTTHQLRLENRQADIPNHKLPTWEDVRALQYEIWETKHIVVDTFNISVEQAIEMILFRLSAASESTQTP